MQYAEKIYVNESINMLTGSIKHVLILRGLSRVQVCLCFSKEAFIFKFMQTHYKMRNNLFYYCNVEV